MRTVRQNIKKSAPLHNSIGPNHWYKTHPNASGNKQSPVDIVPSLAIPDASLFQNQIRWSYHKKYSKTVVNSGHGWTVEYVSTKNYFEGGPAVNRYILDQIHCHWGKSNERGSEHTINGYQMAAEVSITIFLNLLSGCLLV
ncbi:carbonic anhydrase 1-like isoform X3 [Centruroides sculpturatus]|uniref:carbonic anhydrase 1-like isoform X3 n=1 Tax=Centruroides sculpturatus TaxID=218467 RepID=UPI000C6CC3CF|nr:carbonic anhydrase 1-like isoform X3 [Centruroides sculpturatus]